jgi:O-antigen ligase
MIRTSTITAKVPWASRLTLGLAIAVLGVAFFLTEHSLSRSNVEGFSLTTEQLADAVEDGSLRRQLGFSLVAALGLLLLWRHNGAQRQRLRDPLVGLLALYVIWCALSVAWSVDAALTVKRVAVLGFCCLGVLGLTRQLAPRQLCLLAMVLLAGYAILGVAAELALGTFRPWAEEYRFGGTVHPNTQGVYCAVLCLAATALAGRSKRETSLAIGLFVIGAILLVLTRSRTACAGLAVTLAVLALMKVSARTRLLAAVAGAWAVCTLALAGSFCRANTEGKLAEVILLGRAEHLTSLNGRIPLWTELLAYIGKRPLVGHGYGSFWTGAHIADVSEISQWTSHVAHSLYFDAVLGIGIIGLVLLLLAGVLGGCRLAKRYLATGDGGYGFLFGLLVFGAVSGLLESGFLQPTLVPLVAACGLAHVAFCPQEASVP